jgi:PmbA protein
MERKFVTNENNLIYDIIKQAKKAGAEAADCLFYKSSSISVSQRMGQPEGLERSESSGISLRVFVGGKPAIVSSSDISKQAINQMIERVVMMAKLSPIDQYSTLAPQELLATEIKDLGLYDANEVPVAWLQEQCKIAEDAALSVKGVTNSEGAEASNGQVNFALATSNGFVGSYKSSNSSISVSVLAGTDTQMERDYDFTSARFISDLANAKTIGLNAGQKAIKRLGAKSIPTAKMPVVFDKQVSKGLLSAFAGAINGSNIARKTSFLKDSLNKQIFDSKIQIIDEPHRLRGMASKPFDGEGVKNQTSLLVENGVIKTWLLDVRTANKLGLQTTGHATRGLSSPPSPSISNLYMQAGDLSVQELISDIKLGFYVTQVFGMGVNLITGDYSQGAAGFLIENGEITSPVNEVTIAGKLQDMFMEITPANDLEFRYSTNAPTIRIAQMTVAGK